MWKRVILFVVMTKSYLVIEAKEVRTVKEVIRSDGLWRFVCGDVLYWSMESYSVAVEGSYQQELLSAVCSDFIREAPDIIGWNRIRVKYRCCFNQNFAK